MGNFRESQTATSGEVGEDRVEPGVGRSRIAYSNEYYADFVVKPAYEKLLASATDDAGVAYWTALMHNWLTDQQLEARLDLLGTRRLPGRILTDQFSKLTRARHRRMQATPTTGCLDQSDDR